VLPFRHGMIAREACGCLPRRTSLLLAIAGACLTAGPRGGAAASRGPPPPPTPAPHAAPAPHAGPAAMARPPGTVRLLLTGDVMLG
jgi:hypothetical protein